MGKYINKQVVEKNLSEKDKDLMISELMIKLAKKEERISDLENVVAELFIKQNEQNKQEQ